MSEFNPRYRVHLSGLPSRLRQLHGQRVTAPTTHVQRTVREINIVALHADIAVDDLLARIRSLEASDESPRKQPVTKVTPQRP